jgi:hypothetical protein
MSLDRLLETLERDAQAEAERVRAAARAEVEAVRAAAEMAVARRQAEALSARERALRADAAVQLALNQRRLPAVLDAAASCSSASGGRPQADRGGARPGRWACACGRRSPATATGRWRSAVRRHSWTPSAPASAIARVPR